MRKQKNYKFFVAFFLILINLVYANAQQDSDLPTVYRIINSTPTGGRGELQIINALNFQILKKIPFGDGGDVIETTPDKRIAFITRFGTSGKGLTVINLNNGSVKDMFPETTIKTIKLAPNGLLWVLMQSEAKVVLIEPATLQIKHTLLGTFDPQDVIFNDSGSRAYLSLDSQIIVFDTNDSRVPPKLISIIRGITSGLTTRSRSGELALSPNENLLCIARKNSVTLVNVLTSDLVNTFLFNNEARFGLLQSYFINDELIYLAELDGNNIYTLTLTSGEIKKVLNTKIGEIQSARLVSKGNLIYVGDFLGRSVVDTEKQEFLLTGQDLLRVSDGYSLGIALAGDFSIGQAPALRTTAPITNQQVMAGQELTIKWQTTVAPQSFSIASHKVELSTDGGTTFATIPKAENLAADVREFTWQVPSDIEILNKAQIRVSTVDLGAKRANSTTGNFSIIKPGGGQTGDTQAPMVAFLLPKGGERFTSGDNLQISWMSSDNVAVTSQDLSLSTDGGNTFPITLASGLPATTQSFSFPIPMSLQSDQARLRLIVRDAAGNMSQALTPSSFRIELGADTIAPVVTIAQPSANQRLIAGQPIDVKWQSTDNKQLASQAVLLSLDGGNTFATLASFGASDNSFIINNIAELAMTNAQAVVRITATDSSGNIGQASVMFSMSSAITNATYQSRVLSLEGIGFISNASGSTTKLFVNEREITITPTMLSNNNLTIKGSKKKLGIVKGNNSVRLLVNGVSSNTLSFSF